MKIVLQTVSKASVVVDDDVVGAVAGPAVLALVGIARGDGPAEVAKMAERTWNLRILPGEKSRSDVGAPVLAVSQFTLCGRTRSGRRPSWSASASAEESEPVFEAYIRELCRLGAEVETGRFGAHMEVSLTNEGRTRWCWTARSSWLPNGPRTGTERRLGKVRDDD